MGIAVYMLPSTGIHIGNVGMFAMGSLFAGSALWKALTKSPERDPPKDDEDYEW